ncbi:hypothetical protein RGE_21860 [Rubrivivax gelatinosus IL144]|uniref:Uncharacterized protein n=1 Tax=Rubrivivax gelatinosus (strain NBRC 100245 / IL144) TaxID=983917 RepID=I0HR90_RUBGI|nr:hypothetical protein RGE_21860 [Rubrivivax gelatinosus IL144]
MKALRQALPSMADRRTDPIRCAVPSGPRTLAPRLPRDGSGDRP